MSSPPNYLFWLHQSTYSQPSHSVTPQEASPAEKSPAPPLQRSYDTLEAYEWPTHEIPNSEYSTR